MSSQDANVRSGEWRKESEGACKADAGRCKAVRLGRLQERCAGGGREGGVSFSVRRDAEAAVGVNERTCMLRNAGSFYRNASVSRRIRALEVLSPLIMTAA